MKKINYIFLLFLLKNTYNNLPIDNNSESKDCVYSFEDFIKNHKLSDLKESSFSKKVFSVIEKSRMFNSELLKTSSKEDLEEVLLKYHTVFVLALLRCRKAALVVTLCYFLNSKIPIFSSVDSFVDKFKK
jgi:hypothetical protein